MYLALEAMSRGMLGSRHCLRTAGNGIPEMAERTQETEESHGATGAPAARMETVAGETPDVPLDRGLARGDVPWIDDGETEV